jgi:uncharacterized membrane protein YecN with MAPEG domain
MLLPITTLSVGVAAIVLVALSFAVSFQRMRTGVQIGDDGSNVALTRRIRAHGNFAEYVPLALMLIALVEYSGNRDAAIGLAGLLLGGRLAHAGGTLAGATALRGVGMILTHAALFGGVAVLGLAYAMTFPGK